MHRSVRNTSKPRAHLLAGALSGLLLAWCPPAFAQDPVVVDVPAGSLALALDTLAAQTQQQILYASDLVAGRKAKALKGAYTPEGALERLLAGSGITAKRTDAGALVLQRQAGESSPAASPANGDERPFGAAGEDLTPPRAQGSAPSTFTRAAGPNLLEELTVIGSLIRGVEDGPSPVMILDRAQIERSGYTTVAAALAALPQNFAGTVNEGLNNNGGERQGSNSHFGSGLNLRGLGSDATLVLVNGRRMGGAGSNAEFADISTIPTAAIERVELLLDGASALFNAGPSRVQQAGGVPKIAETEDFVDDVVECFLALSAGRSVTSSRECRRKVAHEPG